ncbi:hypothetical protein G9A89_008499 [Geosiphon pyriformis]|nr:hypothetical protein G9A89_008499 [Geosiphon pyriformis]
MNIITTNSIGRLTNSQFQELQQQINNTRNTSDNCKNSLREDPRQWVDFSSASEKEYINTHNNQELKNNLHRNSKKKAFNVTIVDAKKAITANITFTRDFESAEQEANHIQAINLAINGTSDIDTKIIQLSEKLTQKIERFLARTAETYQQLQWRESNNNSRYSQQQNCPISTTKEDNRPKSRKSIPATKISAKHSVPIFYILKSTTLVCTTSSPSLTIKLSSIATFYLGLMEDQSFNKSTPVEGKNIEQISSPFKQAKSNIPPAIITKNTTLNKPITALYTDARVGGIDIKLILNSGSASSIIMKQLMDQLDYAVIVQIITADGNTKTPIRKIDNFLFKINGIQIPTKVLIIETTQYQALVGNDWLLKTNATLNWNTQELQLMFNRQHAQNSLFNSKTYHYHRPLKSIRFHGQTIIKLNYLHHNLERKRKRQSQKRTPIVLTKICTMKNSPLPPNTTADLASKTTRHVLYVARSYLMKNSGIMCLAEKKHATKLCQYTILINDWMPCLKKYKKSRTTLGHPNIMDPTIPQMISSLMTLIHLELISRIGPNPKRAKTCDLMFNPPPRILYPITKLLEPEEEKELLIRDIDNNKGICPKKTHETDANFDLRYFGQSPIVIVSHSLILIIDLINDLTVDLINDLTVDLIIDLIIDLINDLIIDLINDLIIDLIIDLINDLIIDLIVDLIINLIVDLHSAETYTAYTTYYFDQAYFENDFEERNNSINQLLYSATFEQQPPDFEYLNHQIHIWIAVHQATETPFETEEESYQTAPVFDLLSNKLDSSTQTVTSEPMANDPMQANILATLQGIQTALGDDAQDPIEWLDDFERATTANQYDDKYKFQIVGGYLQRSSATWFSQKTDANAQQRIVRWTPANVGEINTSFTTQFEAKFRTPILISKWHMELERRIQGSGEVVTKYAKAIRKLIKCVDFWRNWTEEQKIHFFTKRLRTDLSYALWPLLALKDNPTMDMAIELAQRIEDNQRMHLGSTLPVFAPVFVMAPALQMAATSFATHTQDPNEQLIDRLTANLARLLKPLAQAVRENQQPQKPRFEPRFNQPQQPSYQRQQNRNPPVCYHCGLTGHFSRDCNNFPLPPPVSRNNNAQNNRINNNNVPNQRPNHANINFFGEDPLVEATVY